MSDVFADNLCFLCDVVVYLSFVFCHDSALSKMQPGQRKGSHKPPTELRLQDALVTVTSAQVVMMVVMMGAMLLFSVLLTSTG